VFVGLKSVHCSHPRKLRECIIRATTYLSQAISEGQLRSTNGHSTTNKNGGPQNEDRRIRIDVLVIFSPANHYPVI
jgi:hypothetical protein